jgi:aminoglycoside phosphotransferase (APT) family kinase protein
VIRSRAVPAVLAASQLSRWLARKLGAGAVEVREVARLAGGYSAETLRVEATIDGRAGRYVLRREMPEPAIYPQQAPGLDVEVEIQWRAMSGLARASAVPLAPLVGFERDVGVLGAPFFVMGFVEGQVPSVSPPYTSAGFFAEAKPEERRRMLEDGLSVLARIHAVDWREAGFAWLVAPGTTPGALAQLVLWERYAERELAGREHPLLARGLAWLHARPPAATRLALSWGDARPGNMIWRDFRCACVTDFENVAIAEPELDLGWWLMFDRWSHECFGVPRLAGEPTRDEQRACYERAAGRSIAATTWYEIFAAARYCAIVVRVMNRSVARGELPADQKIWLDNPASTCLAQLLDEVGAG